MSSAARPAARPAAALAAWSVAVLVLLGIAGCATDSAGGGQRGGVGFVVGEDGATITRIESQRRSAPVDLSGQTLEGQRLDIAGLRGEPVVVNVWGSWCSPCRREAPALVAAAARLADRGVSFVGINTRDDDRAQALAFQRTFEVGYPSLVDDGGTLLLALRGAVAPNAIPTTLVLDGQGRIAARITGATTEATLVGVVEWVLDS
jgi:thiol-disulfide isomerase/thioredoxin